MGDDQDVAGRWPVLTTTLSSRTCRGPAASYSTFGTDRGTAPPVQRVIASTGSAPKEIPGLVRPFGKDLLVRNQDGALAVVSADGKQAGTIVPADCHARVAHADGKRGVVVVACLRESGTTLDLYGAGARSRFMADSRKSDCRASTGGTTTDRVSSPSLTDCSSTWIGARSCRRRPSSRVRHDRPNGESVRKASSPYEATVSSWCPRAIRVLEGPEGPPALAPRARPSLTSVRHEGRNERRAYCWPLPSIPAGPCLESPGPQSPDPLSPLPECPGPRPLASVAAEAPASAPGSSPSATPHAGSKTAATSHHPKRVT